MTMSREDGQQNLQADPVEDAPRILGYGLEYRTVSRTQADQGMCGPNSLLGETTVSVGLGGNPYTVDGWEGLYHRSRTRARRTVCRS